MCERVISVIGERHVVRYKACSWRISEDRLLEILDEDELPVAAYRSWVAVGFADVVDVRG